MLELKCPECGEVFFRTSMFLRRVKRCPACSALIACDERGCKLIKTKQQYARIYEPLHSIAMGVQKALGMKKLVPIKKYPWWQVWGTRGRFRHQLPVTKGGGGIQIAPKIEGGKEMPLVARGWHFEPRRMTLAHELAHAHPAGLSLAEPSMAAKTVMERTRIAHGPVFKSTRRHVEKVMKKTGAMKELKKLGYAREDPKFVKTYFNELRQHKVPFRQRMQWLSRIYGGRGGYTSEELYKIVTGKTTAGYYIFPFVKNAPPEVNRILERTYRKHRRGLAPKVAAGALTEKESKKISGIASWQAVKRAGYVKVTKPAPTWVKSKGGKMLQPMSVYKFGIGKAMGGLTERGVRGLWGAARRHPRIVGGVGAFGVGYLTRKELEKRRRRKKGYALEPGAHFTPDIPEPISGRRMLRKGLKTGKAGAARVAAAGASRASMLLIGMMAAKILDRLSKKRPYLPEIRSDIELSGYQVLDQVVQYAEWMPSKMLQAIKTKGGVALHKTKVGIERGLLLWLMGYITAELMARGLTKPKRRHEVVFPEGYAAGPRRLGKPRTEEERRKRHKQLHPGTKLPPRGAGLGYQISGTRDFPFERPDWGFQPAGGTTKARRKLGKLAPAAAIPLAALLAVRLSRRGEQGYSFRSAAGKMLRATKKVGGGIGKGLSVATSVAIPAMILSEFWPRKRKPLPPVQPRYQPYAAGPRRLGKPLTEKERLAKHKRLYPGTPLPPRGTGLGYVLIQMYPFKSTAQRRWMHATHPKMAEEWEEHTPEGKKLPERVSKHEMEMYKGAWKRFLKRRRTARAKRISLGHSAESELRDRSGVNIRQLRRKLGIIAGVGLGATAVGVPAVGWVGHRRKMQERVGLKKPLGVSGHTLRGAAWGAPYYVGRGIAAGRKKIPPRWQKKAATVKKRLAKGEYALRGPLFLRRALGLRRLHKAKVLGKELSQWGKVMAAKMQTLANSAVPGQKLVVAGQSVNAKTWFNQAARHWETVADQAQDMIAKGQLEKLGLLAAGAAAGVAGHEVGRKREKERIRRLVG